MITDQDSFYSLNNESDSIESGCQNLENLKPKQMSLLYNHYSNFVIE